MNMFRLAAWMIAVFLSTINVGAFALRPGASRAEVLETYGYPLSQVKTGEREILNYKEGSVVLSEGRVVELRFTLREPKVLKSQPLSRPESVPVPSSPPPVPSENALSSAMNPIGVAEPSQSKENVVSVSAPSPWRGALFVVVGLGLLAILKITLKKTSAY